MAEETTKQVIEDDPIEVRKAKRAALIEAGENPYGHAFHYTHHLTDLDEKYASLEDGASTEDEVDVAGRIMAKRVQGKIAFFELRDATGDIQLFCRINALGEEVFAAMKDLDVGDWIGVHGTMMRTTELLEHAEKWGMKVITIKALQDYCRLHAKHAYRKRELCGQTSRSSV